jgi:hypothetical protein
MLLQQVTPGTLTFTIGWVDLVIMIVLVIVFLRRRGLFTPVLLLVVALYLVRLFPQEILSLVETINRLNGPAAFITVGG